MHFYKPKQSFLIISIVLIVLLSLLIYYLTKTKALYAYLLSVNIITFLFYGYDKHRAKDNGARIPEVVLHVLALIGGSCGALTGQLFFRHKTRKRKFLAVYAMILVIQTAIIIWVIMK